MKKLTVTQCLNPKFFGDNTPDEPKHEYKITQVINSTIPHIFDVVSESELNIYCEDDEWTVTVK